MAAVSVVVMVVVVMVVVVMVVVMFLFRRRFVALTRDTMPDASATCKEIGIPYLGDGENQHTLSRAKKSSTRHWTNVLALTLSFPTSRLCRRIFSYCFRVILTATSLLLGLLVVFFPPDAFFE